MSNPIEQLIAKYNPKTPQDHENALKEVMQELTLAGLAHGGFFEKAAFYGGTALRIFYGLPRFSEGLDFTLLQTQPDFRLQPYFSSIKEILEAFDFHIELKEDKDRKIESAFLKANTQIHFLKIETSRILAKSVQTNTTMNIKFEVDVLPPLGYETEVKILLPPMTASVKTLKPSSLFAGKMHAVLFRKWKSRIKGRDFYDLLWYLGQNIPLKLSYLETKMREGQILSMDEKITETIVRDLLCEKIMSIDLESAQKDVVTFLCNPKEVQSWNQELFLQAIKKLRFE